MKKQTAIALILIALLLCFTGCGNQGAEKTDGNPTATDSVKDNEKPTVSDSGNTLETVYLITDIVRNTKDKNEITDVRYTYDENGNITEHSDIPSFRRYTYRYDENSNMIEKVCFYKDEEQYRETYVYDKTNNLVQSESFDPRSSVKKVTNYNQMGTPSDITGYMGDEKRTYHTYAYDAYGNLVEANGQNNIEKDDSLVKIQSRFYTYDDSGRVITKTVYSFDKETRRETYTYDEKGNLIEWISCVDGAESQRATYTYDEKDNITEKTYYENGEEKLRYAYTYNTDDLMQTRTTYEEKVKTVLLIHYYDSNGLLKTREFRHYNADGAETGTYSFVFTYTALKLPAAQAETVRKIQYDNIFAGLYITHQIPKDSAIPFEQVSM